MCETHRHSGAGNDVAVLPRHENRLAGIGAHAPQIEKRPELNLAEEQMAPSLRAHAEIEAPRALPEASVREEKTASPAAKEPVQPVSAKPAAPVIEKTKLPELVKPVRPAIISSKVPALPSTKPRQSGAPSPTPTPPAKEDKPKPTPQIAISSPKPSEQPRRQESYVPPTKTVTVPVERQAQAITQLLSTAISVQGNYSGSQKSQLPRIHFWQNQLLNDLRQIFDGGRFKGSELSGSNRSFAIKSVVDKVKEIAGNNVALPKFMDAER